MLLCEVLLMKRVQIILLCAILSVVVVACSKHAVLNSPIKDVAECKALIKQSASQVDYQDYISVTIQPVEYSDYINPDTNKTDETFQEAKYVFRFENTSDKNIRFGAKVYKAQEISDISLHPGPLEDSLDNTVILEPGHGYQCNVTAKILKNSLLSDDKIATLIREYYFAVSINGKMAYFQLDGPASE